MQADLQSQVNGQNNLLLGDLEPDVYRRLASRLELTSMTRGEIVCPSGRKLTHAYFPVSCIISLLHVLEDGATGESAVIGNEGMLDVAIFTGGYTMASEATVQNEGLAYRVPAEVLVDEFNRSTSTRNRLLRYTQTLLAQTSQTAICNRHHTVQQQLCRRLLLTLDRLPGNELHMTQEQIASTLGVRREGISEAAGRLQLAGLITYKRGRITVLDRELLEEFACECYQVVKDECERLDNMIAPPRKHLPYSTERRRRVRPPPPGNH
jgi:CRP-like cAMP-binding protein